MSEREKLISWLNRLQHKTITDIKFNVYVPVDRTSLLYPMEIAVSANGQSSGKIFLAKDGESIAHSTENLREVNAGPYGASEIRSSIRGADVLRLIGFAVQEADLIIEQGVPIGLEIRVSNGSHFTVLNAGDEMVALVDGDHPLAYAPNTVREKVY